MPDNPSDVAAAAGASRPRWRSRNLAVGLAGVVILLSVMGAITTPRFALGFAGLVLGVTCAVLGFMGFAEELKAAEAEGLELAQRREATGAASTSKDSAR